MSSLFICMTDNDVETKRRHTNQPVTGNAGNRRNQSSVMMYSTEDEIFIYAHTLKCFVTYR